MTIKYTKKMGLIAILSTLLGCAPAAQVAYEEAAPAKPAHTLPLGRAVSQRVVVAAARKERIPEIMPAGVSRRGMAKKLAHAEPVYPLFAGLTVVPMPKIEVLKIFGLRPLAFREVPPLP